MPSAAKCLDSQARSAGAEQSTSEGMVLVALRKPDSSQSIVEELVSASCIADRIEELGGRAEGLQSICFRISLDSDVLILSCTGVNLSKKLALFLFY